MIDVGANLLNKQFRGDLDAVLTRARQAGVDYILVTATSLDEAESALDLCARYPGLSCTAGVHPHLASEVDAGWRARLRHLAGHPSVCAIGETGLDFNRNFSPPETQRSVFAEQVELAGELDMPLFVHDRDSDGAVFDMLGAYRGHPDQVLVHCFTGSRVDLERYLDAGYSIGITGWLCDEARGSQLRRLAPGIPLERLVIETDAPFLFPHGAELPIGAESPSRRRRRNEPCLLPFIARRLADLYGLPVEEIERHTTANARRLFRLEAPA